MASRSLNKVMMIGHLGKDAETRSTQSGTTVTNFTLATNRRFKNQQTGEWQEETDWHDIVLWRADALANYLQKGKQIYVEGRLQTRSWEDQSGNRRYRTEVVADPGGVILLGGRDEGAGPSERSAPPRAQAAAGSEPVEPAGGQGITDDDVPF
jgi:single-strand DNA-binding protein